LLKQTLSDLFMINCDILPHCSAQPIYEIIFIGVLNKASN